MSYQLSEADKETIRRDVLAKHGVKDEPKKAGFAGLVKIKGETLEERKARFAEIRKTRPLSFQDLHRFA